jgi:hypothetical protein
MTIMVLLLFNNFVDCYKIFFGYSMNEGEEMKKTLLTLAILMITVLNYAPAFAQEELVIRGTQIKGTGPMNDAKTVGNTLDLTRSARIVSVEGGRDGYCILPSTRDPICVYAGETLVGRTLSAGSYSVRPNIPMNKDQESVTIHLK